MRQTVYPETTHKMTPQRFAGTAAAMLDAVGTVIDGKAESVRHALICLIAEGHLLIEDVPGVGKTMLARSLAATMEASVRRVQFTPDLLPSDVTGSAVYNPVEHRFVFHPGAIFSQVVIADEINRASPKTQSALLEAMEERQVTVDGVSHRLPHPFFVVATLNPMDMEGTYALPEAQLDRFMMRVSMGYPDEAAEARMLRHRDHADPLANVHPVVNMQQIQQLIEWARAVHIAPAVAEYAVALAAATRRDPELLLGASPRATLQLVRAAKARAALVGREFVLPDDLIALITPVFAHRLIAASSSSNSGSVQRALERITSAVPVPAATPRG